MASSWRRNGIAKSAKMLRLAAYRLAAVLWPGGNHLIVAISAGGYHPAGWRNMRPAYGGCGWRRRSLNVAETGELSAFWPAAWRLAALGVTSWQRKREKHHEAQRRKRVASGSCSAWRPGWRGSYNGWRSGGGGSSAGHRRRKPWLAGVSKWRSSVSKASSGAHRNNTAAFWQRRKRWPQSSISAYLNEAQNRGDCGGSSHAASAGVSGISGVNIMHRRR